MPEIQLVHLIYIVSLLTASLAAFGVGGLVPGVIVLVFWVRSSQALTRSRPCDLLHYVDLGMWMRGSVVDTDQ